LLDASCDLKKNSQRFSTAAGLKTRNARRNGSRLQGGTVFKPEPSGDLSETHIFFGGDGGEVEVKPGSLQRML
jgi:hypothetical protein